MAAPSMARLAAILLLCGAFVLPGCEGTSADPRITQIQQLEDKLAEQSRLRAQREAQLEEQSKMIRQLQDTDGGKRLQQLVSVERIEIERLSGGYDDDHDGIDEGAVAYLRLVDRDGDTIKASGSAGMR